jgi:hypothetical protein
MLKRFAVGASLAALLTACGGGSSANNQSTMSTNVQGNQEMLSANITDPMADESANALSNAPAPVTADTAPAEAAPAEKTSVAGRGQSPQVARLLMAIQILFWFVSGLFFAIAPIEQVRSEHMIAEAAGRADLAGRRGGRAPAHRRGRSRSRPRRSSCDPARPAGRPGHGAGARPRFYDLGSGQLLSPLSAPPLSRSRKPIMRAISARPRRRWWKRNRPNIAARSPPGASLRRRRQPLLYVAADTGAVGARRSTLVAHLRFPVVAPHHGLQEPRGFQHAAADHRHRARADRDRHRAGPLPQPARLQCLAPAQAGRAGSAGGRLSKDDGEPCWVRTSDLLIKSQLLYRLS